jgi:hypothetical protein
VSFVSAAARSGERVIGCTCSSARRITSAEGASGAASSAHHHHYHHHYHHHHHHRRRRVLRSRRVRMKNEPLPRQAWDRYNRKSTGRIIGACFVLSCLVLSCPVLSCLVLSAGALGSGAFTLDQIRCGTRNAPFLSQHAMI